MFLFTSLVYNTGCLVSNGQHGKQCPDCFDCLVFLRRTLILNIFQDYPWSSMGLYFCYLLKPNPTFFLTFKQFHNVATALANIEVFFYHLLLKLLHFLFFKDIFNWVKHCIV